MSPSRMSVERSIRVQAEGQDEGAALQGLGHTLFESLEYDNGQPLNANLVDYRVPRFTDLPDISDPH